MTAALLTLLLGPSLMAAEPAPVPAAAPAPAVSTEPASVVLQSAPGGAELYVDDEFRGRAGAAGRLVVRGLAPGAHQLRVDLAGHKEEETRAELRAGETFEWRVQLAKAEPPAPPPAAPKPKKRGHKAEPAQAKEAPAAPAPALAAGQVYYSEMTIGDDVTRVEDRVLSVDAAKDRAKLERRTIVGTEVSTETKTVPLRPTIPSGEGAETVEAPFDAGAVTLTRCAKTESGPATLWTCPEEREFRVRARQGERLYRARFTKAVTGSTTAEMWLSPDLPGDLQLWARMRRDDDTGSMESVSRLVEVLTP